MLAKKELKIYLSYIYLKISNYETSLQLLISYFFFYEWNMYNSIKVQKLSRVRQVAESVFAIAERHNFIILTVI